MKHYSINIAIICLLWSSCRPSSLSETKYQQWIANPSNGLCIQRQTPGLQLDLQYLPPELLAAQKNTDQRTMDSLLHSYGQSLNFVFTIGPREGKAKGDITYKDINSPIAYKSRQMTLNFGMGEYWILHTDSGEYHPVIANVENTYGLTDYRKLHLVFVPDTPETNLRASSKWDVQYNDEVFGTGIHHFVFNKEDWENLPRIKTN